MKISQISNQNQKCRPSFQSKIEAPNEFWHEVTHSSLSKRVAEKVQEAMMMIDKDSTDEIIEISRHEEKGFFKDYFSYSAKAKSSGLNIAEKTKGSWADFLIYVADRFVNEYKELSDLVKRIRA